MSIQTNPINSGESGAVVRAKINTLFAALITGTEGINKVWSQIRELAESTENLGENLEEVDQKVIKSSQDSVTYTNKQIDGLLQYVNALKSGAPGLIPSTDYDPQVTTEDSATFIAVGAGTFTNFKDSSNQAIVISGQNTITIFYKASGVDYWTYKSAVISSINVRNEFGSSTTDAPSQKLVTDNFNAATFSEETDELASDIEAPLVDIFNQHEAQRDATFNSKEAARDAANAAATDAASTLAEHTEKLTELGQEINPDITESSRFNDCISELFIDGYTPGMKFYIFTYTNGLLTIVIKDANDNLYTFADDKPVSANVPIYLNKSGIDLYIILSGVTQTAFPSNAIINDCVADLKFSPRILSYLIKQNEEQIQVVDEKVETRGTYPICVSRFNRGTLPNADHNACWVSISRRFTNAKDSVVNFTNKINANITNKFFDLYSIGTIDRGIDAVAPVNDYTDSSTFWSLSTSDAIFMPMIVGAVHNIDGDNTTEKWFTGGAHAYGNESDGVSPTIREISCDVLVDGKNVQIGTIGVRGNSCDIYVVENIQGWNTCKQDGTGREIIQRKTHIKVTNCKIAINVEIKALEDVIVDGPLYASGIGTNNADGFRFIGSHSKMGIYTGEAIPANDDNEINAFRYIKSSFIFDCLYNLEYGVKNKYVTSVANLFASDAGKAYFRAIQQGVALELMQNDSIFYCTEISLSEDK